MKPEDLFIFRTMRGKKLVAYVNGRGNGERKIEERFLKEEKRERARKT